MCFSIRLNVTLILPKNKVALVFTVKMLLLKDKVLVLERKVNKSKKFYRDLTYQTPPLTYADSNIIKIHIL